MNTDIMIAFVLFYTKKKRYQNFKCISINKRAILCALVNLSYRFQGELIILWRSGSYYTHIKAYLFSWIDNKNLHWKHFLQSYEINYLNYFLYKINKNIYGWGSILTSNYRQNLRTLINKWRDIWTSVYLK